MTHADDDLQQMYQEVILAAARNPHGRQSFAEDVTREDAAENDGAPSRDAGAEATLRISHEACAVGQSHQFNPTCGDEVTVHVEVSRETPHRIIALVWDGHGCSISQASLSVMTDLVEGKTVDEAMRLSYLFHELMQSRGKGLDDEQAEDELGDAIVFQGASQYPMRIKCALLGWEALRGALATALNDVPDSSTQATNKES